MNFETIQDFLDNERFSQWLKTSDPELELFWQDWLEKNESRKELFYKAVSAWLLIRETPPNWSEAQAGERLSLLTSKLRRHSSPRPIRRYWYYAAASVALLAGLIGFLTKNSFRSAPAPGYSAHNLFPEHWENIRNSTTAPLLVNLPDGSSALLSPGSDLSFHPEFLRRHRIVNLTGEAFFEVVKNPSVPFYVHTPSLTTKVLGTSFQVRSFEKESASKVTVLNGKVEVSHASTTSKERIILAKNEEAVLPKDAGEFVKSAPEAGARPLPNLPETYTFDLKFIPARDIFLMLEKMYGVRILYDAERFSHCTLTANLEDVPFLKKLELICAGMDAQYSINGPVIEISGTGCQE